MSYRQLHPAVQHPRGKRLFPALAIAILLAGLLLTLPRAHAQHPTPALTRLLPLEIPPAIAFVGRARLAGTRTHMGLALICRPAPDRHIQITVHFGTFPADGRPVQLALRTPDRAVIRFGPVIRAGPASGFHSPRITHLTDARRFVSAALRNGTLISNGYRSFWNRIPERENRQVRQSLVPCLDPEKK